MTKAEISRINELSQKKKNGTLTETEKAEQISLRNKYREEYRQSFINTLEHTYVIDGNGEKKKILKTGDET